MIIRLCDVYLHIVHILVRIVGIKTKDVNSNGNFIIFHMELIMSIFTSGLFE